MVILVAVVALAALAVAACASGTAGSSSSPGGASAASGPIGSGVNAAAIGRAFVEALATGDTAAAQAMEDGTMRSAAPAPALGQLWDQVVAQFGAYQGIGTVETIEAAPFVNATVATGFANATVPLIVTVDREGRVAGLHLGQPGPAPSGSSPAPSSPAPTASPAGYVDPAAFTETEVTVGEAPWALPGTLSMPEGEGPVPGVVLLAGSGPNDRDETIGPNAPLRDIAGGLASDGIAVLRFDKRTKVYGAQMAADPAHLTVQEETVDDAVAAVDLLRRTPGVDPERVFVVGHSLGGFLAPRVASRAIDRVAGIAILEANTSPLQDLILRQFEYLASEAGGASPDAAAALPAIREQVALVDAGTISASTPAASLPLGLPAAYWLDLRGYDPAATAAGLTIPVFISQGGRDYQVPPSELEGWRSALADRDGVTIREYPRSTTSCWLEQARADPPSTACPGMSMRSWSRT